MLIAVSRPYTSQLTDTLKSNNGRTYNIPRTFVERYPKLKTRLGDCSLKKLSEDCCHVLVNYLYTNTYQALDLRNASLCENKAAQFETSLQMYMFTEECDMYHLQDLAMVELERLGPNIPVTQLLDLAANTNYASNDKWFQNFIKSLIEPALGKGDLPEHSGQTISLSSIVLRAVAELWHDKKDGAHPAPIPAPIIAPIPAPSQVAKPPATMPWEVQPQVVQPSATTPLEPASSPEPEELGWRLPAKTKKKGKEKVEKKKKKMVKGKKGEEPDIPFEGGSLAALGTDLYFEEKLRVLELIEAQHGKNNDDGDDDGNPASTFSGSAIDTPSSSGTWARMNT